MKKFLLLFLLVLPFAFSQQIEYFVNDYTNTLAFEEIAEIEPILKEIYDSGQAEYVIVIVNSTNGEDIEGYSYRLAEGNLGDKEKNNGLLLLIALNDRNYRFEVGRGLEPVLPDIIVSRIGRYYIEPNFRNGEYALGIEEASLAIKQILLNNTVPQELKNDNAETRAWIIFVIIILVAIIIFSIASKNTRPAKGRKSDDYFTAAWILSQMMKGGKGGSGGFGGGGSFGGFGGGSFGGGGSSGRW